MSLVINLVNLVLLVLTIIVLNTIKDKKVKTILIGITLLFTFVVRLFIRLNLVIWFIFYAVIILIGKLLSGKEKGEKQPSESSLSLRIVCLLIPLVGLIVYAVNIVQSPKIAKECGKWALVGFSIGIVLSVISMCIVMLG